MKIAIESTTKIVEVNGVPARIWQGTTAAGIPVTAAITSLAVDREHDQAEFDADLTEHAAPTVGVGHWPDHMFIDHGGSADITGETKELQAK